MHISVEGFILSEVSYKDSSKILNILTKEYGIIGVLATGCKKMKSPLRSYSQKFIYAIFNIKYKEGKLSYLVSADVLDYFKNIRSDLSKISYLTYMVDLSNQVYNESFNKDIYDILVSSIKKLENGLDQVVLTNIMETKYLNYLGVSLEFNECSVCNQNNILVNYNDKTLEFSCEKCSSKNEEKYKLIRVLKNYNLIKIDSLSKIDIDKNIKEHINIFLKNYYDNYTGIYVYSKNFIENNDILKSSN